MPHGRRACGATLKLLILAVFLTGSLSQHTFAAFQERLWGARPAGMAGAFSALADDANAPAYNPAGVSLLAHNELTIMYAQLYTGLNLYAGEDTSRLGLGYFAFVPQIQDKRFGSFALSWTNFAATNLLREDAFALTWADSQTLDRFATSPIVAYGANLKLLRRSFSTDSRTDADPTFNGGRDASAATADIGLMLRPNFRMAPGLKFGFSAQNINEPDMGLSATDRVPARYTLGIAYQEKNLRILNPALDLSRRSGRTLVTLANESWFLQDSFAFRVGGNQDELGGGFGYQFRAFSGLMLRLDYSLLWPLDITGTTGSHRLSLTTNF